MTARDSDQLTPRRARQLRRWHHSVLSSYLTNIHSRFTCLLKKNSLVLTNIQGHNVARRMQYMKYANRITFVLLVLCLPTAAAQFAHQRQIDYPLQGVVLGNGWSTLAATKTPGKCIEFEEMSDLSEDRTVDIRRVVDKEQLNRELNVSVEFQAKAISGVGGSAKAAYSKSLEIKNDALNLVISAKVMQGAKFVTAKSGTPAVRLTDSAAELAATEMPKFLALCGDSFVAAIHAGGELNAFLNFDVASTDERESISTSMSASGLTFSGSASMNQTMRQYRESQKLRILIHSAGGTGIPIPVNEQELLTRLGSLPTDAKTAPKPYRISILRYDALPNWPDVSLTAIEYANMERLVGQYQRYSSLYYDAFSILQSPDSYVFRGGLTLNSVQQLQDQLRLTVLPSLTTRIADCLAGKSCGLPANINALDYTFRAQMPIRVKSFAEDIQMRQLSADKSAAEAAYTTAPEYIYLHLLGVSVELPNPEKIELKKRLDGLAANLNATAAAYPAALANAMYKQWIESISFNRCITDPIWDYCLSNQDLAFYKNRIIALVE